MEPLSDSAQRAIIRHRRRAAKACDRCRRQKEKCDGGFPCRRCTRLKRECEFSGRPVGLEGRHDAGVAGLPETSPARPGTARMSEVAASSASGPTTSSAELLERIADLERVVQRYAGHVPMDTEGLRALAEDADRHEQRSTRSPPPNRSTSTSDSGGIGLGSFTIKPLANNMTHCEFVTGPFSHWSFSMSIKEWIDQTALPNHPPNSTNVAEYYRAEELQSPSNIAMSAAALPPRFITDFLVQAFFTHGQANYWYVEREWLTQKIDIIYDDPASLTQRDVGTVCIIFTVLAIGTQYAYLDLYKDQQGNATATQSQPGAAAYSEDSIGVMFYQQACRLLPDMLTVSSLECVQACLLIGIYTLPIDASGLSYVYLNLAVKLAIQNGMHRRYKGDDLSPSVRETRNRVWWTACTIERRVGVFHGRPLAISDRDVDVDLPVAADGLLSSTTLEHLTHVLATLRLNRILSQILYATSALKTYTKQEMPRGMERLVELHHELTSWWESLPANMSCKQSEPTSSISRMGVHLKLEYCLARIFVGRAFIFRQEKTTTPSDTTTTMPGGAHTRKGSESSTSRPDRESPRSILVADCIEASLEVVATCRAVRDSIGLARASYTEFSSCRAALLVITTQCLQKKTDKFRRTLRDGLSMLKEMSAGGESAWSEMLLIEAFERAIAKMDAAAPEKRADSQYSRFKQWEQLWKSDQPGGSESGRSMINPLPMAPGVWEPLSGGQPQQQLHQDGIATITGSMPSHTPFFGMDGDFASFPQQTLDEFSMCLGYNLGPSPDASASASTGTSANAMDTDGGWMGSIQ